MSNKTLQFLGIIVTIISIVFGVKSWLDKQSCEEANKNLQTQNVNLTIQLGNIKNEYDKVYVQNQGNKREKDSLRQVVINVYDQYNKNLEFTNSLRDKRDSLNMIIDSLQSVLSADINMINILNDSLRQLNDSIISLEEKNDKLWSSVNDLIRKYKSIDTNSTYKDKYYSLVSVIDSFFVPFRVDNIKVTPLFERKKGVFLPSRSKNGIYERDDFTKIEVVINTKLSEVFLLNLPDSIIARKRESQKIYVNFYSVPNSRVIKPLQTKIIDKLINYVELVELDLSLGYISFRFDNPIIRRRGEMEYIFEFYTKYSFEPFYKYSIKTE